MLHPTLNNAQKYTERCCVPTERTGIKTPHCFLMCIISIWTKSTLFFLQVWFKNRRAKVKSQQVHAECRNRIQAAKKKSTKKPNSKSKSETSATSPSQDDATSSTSRQEPAIPSTSSQISPQPLLTPSSSGSTSEPHLHSIEEMTQRFSTIDTPNRVAYPRTSPYGGTSQHSPMSAAYPGHSPYTTNSHGSPHSQMSQISPQSSGSDLAPAFPSMEGVPGPSSSNHYGGIGPTASSNGFNPAQDMPQYNGWYANAYHYHGGNHTNAYPNGYHPQAGITQYAHQNYAGYYANNGANMAAGMYHHPSAMNYNGYHTGNSMDHHMPQ